MTFGIILGKIGVRFAITYILDLQLDWKRGWVVESARLESVYTLIAYRGFESLRFRQINKKLAYY